MAFYSFPTSRDIYIEVEGVRLAAAQEYLARSTRKTQYVEAFGQEEPVGCASGPATYRVELTHGRALAPAPQVDFHALEEFSLVVVQPGKRVIYSGCRWESLQESAQLGGLLLEKAVLLASGRSEVAE